jgi:uncharacterized protein involved in exopolysaccharide biosynthesis
MVAVKTQVAIIQSVDLAKRVVEALKLLDSPESQSGLGLDGGGLAEWITRLRQRMLGIKPPDTKPPDTKPTTADRTQALAGILLGHVTASNDGKSYLVQVGAETKDAKLSAEIANTLAQTYLDFNRRLKIHAIDDANARFFDQLPPLAQKVREADREVQKFRSDNGLTPVANAAGGGAAPWRNISSRTSIRSSSRRSPAGSSRKAACGRSPMPCMGRANWIRCPRSSDRA